MGTAVQLEWSASQNQSVCADPDIWIQGATRLTRQYTSTMHRIRGHALTWLPPAELKAVTSHSWAANSYPNMYQYDYL